jgi:hypothetical protein
VTVPAQRHAHGDGCLLDPAVDDWVCPQQRPACSGDPCTCGALVTPWSHCGRSHPAPGQRPGKDATASHGPPR